MNKKLLCSIIFFLSVFSLFSQVIDYTGKGNPYKNLSQKEKDEKLLEICDKWYSKSDDNDNYETKAGLLLDAGANPNAKKDDKSLLHLAISNQNHALSRLLIEYGADTKYVSKNGESIVYLMIDANYSLNEIKYAVHKGAIITSNKIKPFLSPLSKAAASGNFELLEFCISNGCKPSDCEKDDPPPVYYALRNGDIKSVEFLLKNGDNINKKINLYSGGYTYPLHLTLICTDSSKGYAELDDGIITRAIELGADPFLEASLGNAFSYATDLFIRAYKQPQKVRNIMELFDNMDKCLPKKYTKTLNEAFLSGDTKALTENCESYKNEYHANYVYTYATYCNIKNKKECIDILLKAGLKPSYYNLMYALSYSNNVSYFKKLIPYVDLKNGDDNYKHDFLSFCISNPYEFDFDQSSLLISTLLENGFTADTLIYDEKREKEYPLFFFVCLNMCFLNQKPAEILLKHGANINAQYNGNTVLDILNHRTHINIINYLKEQGAKESPNKKFLKADGWS